MWEIKALYRLPWRVLFPAIPALLIRTSTPPKLFLTHLKAATISSSFETSAFTAYSAPLHPLTLFFSSCANIVEFYCGLHIQMESGQEILATKRETTRQWRTVTDWCMCVFCECGFDGCFYRMQDVCLIMFLINKAVGGCHDDCTKSVR